MAEPDSWEDSAEAEAAPAPPKPTLNPNAKSFTFNPNAKAFNFAPAAKAAPAQPPAPAAVAAPAPAVQQPTAPAPEPAAPSAADVAAEAIAKVSISQPAAPEEVKVKDDASKEEDISKLDGDGGDDVPLNPEEEAALLEEMAGEVGEVEDDPREHINLVFIGHVDAGKSTIGGHILLLSGMVDQRTIQKYEREAKENNRDSWYMAYIMDTNPEERAKGKTVEVGRAHFATDKKRYTILDAPGHKNFVPNMIGGASQADAAVLVVSARKGEFETGFERGGQTREHAQLAKTLGVRKLIVVVNKMDSVDWELERYTEIQTKLTPFLKTCGYNTKDDVEFVPISGMSAENLKEHVSAERCPWWDGKPTLFEILDNMKAVERDPNGPVRMPILDKFRDMGTMIMGKLESGTIKRGDALVMMPNKVTVKVASVYRDATEVAKVPAGENVRLRITGLEEEDILSGFVLSSLERPCPAVTVIEAQLAILELLEHKAIFTAGYTAVLHIHSIVEECEVVELLTEMDHKTKKPKKKKPMFVKSGSLVTCRIELGKLCCVEKFSDFPQLGRFTLRDEGKTIAIGKIVGLPQVTA
eukprot:jgi/Mesvir1/29459/Mv23034-RA.1